MNARQTARKPIANATHLFYFRSIQPNNTLDCALHRSIQFSSHNTFHHFSAHSKNVLDNVVITDTTNMPELMRLVNECLLRIISAGIIPFNGFVSVCVCVCVPLWLLSHLVSVNFSSAHAILFENICTAITLLLRHRNCCHRRIVSSTTAPPS